jgi:hypothetical protein
MEVKEGKKSGGRASLVVSGWEDEAWEGLGRIRRMNV